MITSQVETVAAFLRAVIGNNCGLGGTVKFDFGDAGSVLVDGKSAPNKVSDGRGRSADCTMGLSLETFEKLVLGEIDPSNAYMMGMLRVGGNMVLALKMGPILGRGRI